MLSTHTISLPSSSPTNNIHGLPTTTTKRKRKPAGTPDPDAEVVYLCPESLMESDRYVCEVCNLSFQREQNLQMHRRRHKLPWSLHKNDRPPHEAAVVRKRVYVCPEPSCVHHDPAHALGDLVGIKKHFRRKHSNHKQWVCERCSKGYAVHSDYKAHLKTCGTRGHSCDCGRVFSRVETFIEHQDSCKARRKESGDRLHPFEPPSPFLSPPSSFMKPIFNLNLSTLDPHSESRLFSSPPSSSSSHHHHHHHTLELRELFPSKKTEAKDKEISTVDDDRDEGEDQNALMREVSRLKSETKELMRVAMEQKAKAAEKRNQARLLMEMANQDMERASKIREEALLTEIRNAQLQKDGSSWQMLVNGGQRKITCDSCKVKCSNNKEFQESSSAQQVKEMVGHGISCYPKVNYYFPSPITHGENVDNSLTFRSLRLG